jgi:hypothetical protein
LTEISIDDKVGCVSNTSFCVRIPMNRQEPTTLESFHRFVGKQLETNAAVDMSPERAVALWREEQETLAAIHEGLDDVAAGRTMPLEEFDRKFRQKHGIADHS